MYYKSILLLIYIKVLIFSSLSQNTWAENKFELQWGALTRSPGALLEILPKQDQDFYSLRWSGGRVFGTYRITDHEGIALVQQQRIKQVAGSGIANFETALYIGDQLYVFLSDKVKGQLVLYLQPLDEAMLPEGPSKLIASYNNPKINAKPNFSIISSRNKKFVGIVWEVPGRKSISDSYGYVILNKDLKNLYEGEYNIPLNGNMTSINEHYVSNYGNYFLSLTEHKEPNDKLFTKAYDNFRALHVYQIRDDALTEFSLDLEGKRIDDLKMSSNDQGLFTLSGIYGENEVENKNRRQHVVDGIFMLRLDTSEDSLVFKGFIPFKRDFINMNFKDRSIMRSRRKKKKNQELYNFKIRDIFTLTDGSLTGSIEQYYIYERTSYDSRTGLSSTIYYYYYDDIIAFKIGNDGTFDWQKKIEKSQVSTNDGGPFSSYSSFTDGASIYFIFNDNMKNYNNEGNFIKSAGNCYSFNLSRRKNVAAITSIELNSGISSRHTLLARKELKSIVVPKMFKLDPINNKLLLYALLGNKERFGILKF